MKWIAILMIAAGATSAQGRDLSFNGQERITFYSQHPKFEIDPATGMYFITPGGESGFIVGGIDYSILEGKPLNPNYFRASDVRILIAVQDVIYSYDDILYRTEHGEYFRFHGSPIQTHQYFSLFPGFSRDEGMVLKMSRGQTEFTVDMDDLRHPLSVCEAALRPKPTKGVSGVFKGDGNSRNSLDPRRWRDGSPWANFRVIDGSKQ